MRLPHSPGPVGHRLRVLTVTNGTLSVEPGTVVRFAEGGGLRIGTNASLQTVGLADARIRFEGAAAIQGYGLGIFLEPDSLASTVAYTDFAYLGREDVGTFKFWNGALGGLYGGGLRLTDTTIMGSNFFGADLGNLPLLEFRGNFFYDNARAGLSVTAPQVALLDAGTDYLGGNYPNGEPYIHVGGLEPLLVDTVWEARNAPYLIDGALYVEGATFVPAPGVQIVFAEGSGMVVSGDGTLYALGTAQYPVVFTVKSRSQGIGAASFLPTLRRTADSSTPMSATAAAARSTKATCLSPIRTRSTSPTARSPTAPPGGSAPIRRRRSRRDRATFSGTTC